MFNIANSNCYLIAKAHQRSSTIMARALSRHGLTPPQFIVLATLWQGDGISQTELSLLCQMDRTTLSAVLDRLSKEGALTRMQHPDDRRSFQVWLTSKGRALRDELSQAAEEAETALLVKLSDEERLGFAELLRKIGH